MENTVMPHFFSDQKIDNQIFITGEDFSHMSRVLRMRVGEKVSVSHTNGMDYDCQILEYRSDCAVLEILEEYPNQTEPSIQITLFQALPKGDKLDLITQKAVELGVSRIVPVLTKRCVSRPDGKSMQKKIIRYQKIAKEAAKQSGRGIIPEIGELLTFSQALEQLRQMECPIFFYEKGGRKMSEFVSPSVNQIGIMIGSEGGFEAEEAEQAAAAGLEIATLGRLILRCETAPLAAISVLMNLTGNI